MLHKLITNPFVRSWARRTGLIALAKKFTRSKRYEERFDVALSATVRPGDCVWDIGANVGFYTVKLAALAGERGSVQAFEPFATTFARLRDNVATAGCRNVRAHRIALGSENSEMTVPVTDADSGVTNSLGSAPTNATRSETVQIRRGDDLVASGVPAPTVLKVDVEAFEWEVLEGLRQTLRGPTCRAVFCEIHFARLEARGLCDAPRRIESLLIHSGFAVTWLDASHIGAERRPTL